MAKTIRFEPRATRRNTLTEDPRFARLSLADRHVVASATTQSQLDRARAILATVCPECGGVMNAIPEAGRAIRACARCEHVDTGNTVRPGFNPAPWNRPTGVVRL